jgi:hypothetical protein
MVVMMDLKNDNLRRPQHAFFQESKFSYPGRNGTFLNLIGLRRPLENVFLLGSGPVEPFETAALPCFKTSAITAVDSDPEVCRIVLRGIETGELDRSTLAQVCRSPDSENRYFLDDDRMHRQLQKVRAQGWHAGFNDSEDITKLYVDREDAKRRVRIILCDLQKEIPTGIGQADLIFEGFMLVNWEKKHGGSSSSELFLRRLSGSMSPHAWFASATSVTHYLGEFPGSKPFLRQVLGAGLLPAAGVLMRWSVSDRGQVTSQFGSVFCKEDRVQGPLLELGGIFEKDSLRAVSTLGVRLSREIVNVESLVALVEKGDVLSFVSLDGRAFRVLRAAWSELSRQCGVMQRAYELGSD